MHCVINRQCIWTQSYEGRGLWWIRVLWITLVVTNSVCRHGSHHDWAQALILVRRSSELVRVSRCSIQRLYLLTPPYRLNCSAALWMSRIVKVVIICCTTVKVSSINIHNFDSFVLCLEGTRLRWVAHFTEGVFMRPVLRLPPWLLRFGPIFEMSCVCSPIIKFFFIWTEARWFECRPRFRFPFLVTICIHCLAVERRPLLLWSLGIP